jgi:serine/arginine repetitive matrix protein 2
MYNGIGLTTARGTATNGYVQKNVAYRRTDQVRRNFNEEHEAPKTRKPNQAILDHQRKRQVELCLAEWAEETKLYENNTEEVAETLLDEKRAEFTDQQTRGVLHSSKEKDRYGLYLSWQHNHLYHSQSH